MDQLEKNLEKCYEYIEKLDRPDLINLLKYEIQMRTFSEERVLHLETYIKDHIDRK